MNTLLVGYDLNRPSQNYEDLFKIIKAEGTWCHNLDSAWLVRSSKTASELLETIAGHIGKSDEVIVIDITGRSAAWINFPQEASDWVQRNL